MGHGHFDEERKKNAVEDIRIIYKCAEEAGIRHAVFVGFGLLLGIIRERDFIGHDSDVDMCVFSDKITPEQELRYFKLLEEKEMFFSRRRAETRRCETGWDQGLVAAGGTTRNVRFAWFSLRRREDHCKFCHWFWLPWNGYYWHTKAGQWISRRKFDPDSIGYEMSDEGIMKGIPAGYIENLIEIEFKGLKINIPENYGTCLDFWYPGWLIPKKGGASTKTAVAVVKDWLNQDTWRRVR